MSKIHLQSYSPNEHTKKKEKIKIKNKDFFYLGNTFLNFFVYFCKFKFDIK